MKDKDSQLILGLGHRARQGKDTFVNAVTSYFDNIRAAQIRHGLKIAAPVVQRIGFADALYEMCRKDYGMIEKDAPLLQNVGAEMRQKNGENFWFDQGVKKINSTAGIVIFTDVRYRNEAIGLRKLQACLIDIQRYDQYGDRFVAQDRPANHPSETELDGFPFDSILCNMHGHQALFEEQAITLTIYFRALKGHK